MDTKKTIFVSIATTLATMFVVAVLVHLCSGNCGRRNGCSKEISHCSYMKSHCKKSSSCASYSSHCSSTKSCSSTSSCSGKSTCSKRSKCSKGKKCSSKTSCSKGKNGEHIVKEIIKVEEEE